MARKKWVPKPKQAALLEAARKPDVKRTISAMCKAADVATSTFYDWMEVDPDFRAAWERQWRRSIDLHFNSVVAAMLKKATDGQHQPARLIAELKGVLAKRVEVTGKDGGPVKTVDMAKLSIAELEVLAKLGELPNDDADDEPEDAAGNGN